MRHVRSKGLTYTSTLRRSVMGAPGHPRNQNRGPGALARSALTGSWPFGTPILAIEVTAITHGHVEAQASAAVMAVMVDSLLNGNRVEFAAHEAIRRTRDVDGAEPVQQAVEAALVPNPVG